MLNLSKTYFNSRSFSWGPFFSTKLPNSFLFNLSEWKKGRDKNGWFREGEGREEKNQVEILAENLLFQEMNGEKFLIRLYITDEKAGIVSDNQSTLQMISVTADGRNKNVIYELHPEP